MVSDVFDAIMSILDVLFHWDFYRWVIPIGAALVGCVGLQAGWTPTWAYIGLLAAGSLITCWMFWRHVQESP